MSPMMIQKFSPRRLNAKISSLIGGRRSKGQANNLSSKLTVQEEYKAAFRTESYIEIWSKVQGRLKITNYDRKMKSSPSPSPCSSSSASSSNSVSIHIYKNILEDLLEPRQETIDDMIGKSNLHPLLADYFQVSLQACNICEVILQSVHQSRENYQIIKKIWKVLADSNKDGSRCNAIVYRELSKFALLKNPLSVVNPVKFHEIHVHYKELLRKMSVKYKKVRRRAKFTKFCKKIAGFSIVACYSAVVIALVALALHGGVGLACAPVLLAGCFGSRRRLCKKRLNPFRSKRSGNEKRSSLGPQIDVAAKGLFILINDLDTMSRLVGRLHDEIEHHTVIANVCVRNEGRGNVLKQVVKEFHVHEPYFMEQLDELENHIYLCFLTINRSRRLLLDEIKIQPDNNHQRS